MNLRVAGAVALGVGAVLAVCGSLLELYRVEFRFSPDPDRVDVQVFTAWQSKFDFAGMDKPESTSGLGWGLPITAAVVLVVVGLVLLFRSPLLNAVGRVVVVAAGGVLIGTTWSAYETLDRLFGAQVVPDGKEFVGAGLWMLVVACLAVAVGAGLVQEWPPRAPKPDGPSVYRVDDEDDTPPFGIPIPTDEIDVDRPGESPERG
ncbi:MULTISPECIES: hypothetical protein [unclassified Saccharothrix]|uniref:hypothetical protein n=1 Tax=unclassified Saccharothrix TaxID=2593673 RepID=UPI00307F8017